MDPYKVLGVSPTASDEEIRQAYRALAKKYHPDNYVNNPIADLAAEKMKEINQAYDQITKMRSGKSADVGGGSDPSYAGSDSRFRLIRAYIAAGNLSAAETLLNEIADHSAEWHFLKGSLAYRYGRLDQAREFFRIAHDLEPQNSEYTAANDQMNRARDIYRDRGGYSRKPGTADACDCCSSLICADCCCECMGGDLIPCC